MVLVLFSLDIFTEDIISSVNKFQALFFELFSSGGHLFKFTHKLMPVALQIVDIRYDLYVLVFHAFIQQYQIILLPCSKDR